MTILRITVDGASYDEPEEFFVEDSAAVRAAINSWQEACAFHLDGAVEAEETDYVPAETSVLTEEEFLEAAANGIGANAEEIDNLLKKWRES